MEQPTQPPDQPDGDDYQQRLLIETLEAQNLRLVPKSKAEANEKCAEFVRKIWAQYCFNEDIDGSDVQPFLDELGLLKGVMPEGCTHEEDERYILIDALTQ